MQSVETGNLDNLCAKLEHLLRELPISRRELHTKIADVAKSVVDRKVANTINDSNYTVRGWQAKFVGSGGGYAAVRAKSGTSGADSPGAITNYLENGHATPRRDGFIAGRNMYRFAQAEMERRAQELAEQFAAELAQELGG